MITAIAFDLDDTLLDTTRLLVPAASKQAFEAMSSLQLRCSFAEFDRERSFLSRSFSHKVIFVKLAQKWSTLSSSQVKSGALFAIESFYNPIIPDTLPLMPGALENLLALKKYNLYLVTAGAKETQKKKILACKIESYFKKCFLFDGFEGERKKTAFDEILRLEKMQPSSLLCIGNRLGQEIRDGKLSGAQTCYFEYGEHVGELAQQPEDFPDFKIKNHSELIPTCRL